MVPHWLILVGPLLAPLAPSSQTRPVLDSVWRATRNPTEIAVLVAINRHENSLGRAGVPFGVCNHLCRTHCTHCRTEPLRLTARVALRIWRRSGTSRGCGVHAGIQERLHYYHSGPCRGWQADGFAATEAETVERILHVRGQHVRRHR